MADFEFESRLDKMFGESQSFEDAAPFASRVQSKLNRRWTTRRLVIGGLGGLGGLIGVGQIIGSGVLSRLSAFNGGSVQLTANALNRWTEAHVNSMTLPNAGTHLMLRFVKESPGRDSRISDGDEHQRTPMEGLRSLIRNQ